MRVMLLQAMGVCDIQGKKAVGPVQPTLLVVSATGAGGR